MVIDRVVACGCQQQAPSHGLQKQHLLLLSCSAGFSEARQGACFAVIVINSQVKPLKVALLEWTAEQMDESTACRPSDHDRTNYGA
jgi:hypothetical protein